MLKRLYKYPIKEFFRSHILNIKLGGQDTPPLPGVSPTDHFSFLDNKETYNNIIMGGPMANFSQSNLILTPLEKTRLASLNKISSINSCYKNIIYNRHRTYLTNQWWNAQQGEHNAETTFLSDIDWRYTFVPSFGDVQVDFPDSDQFYNPRNRRWMLTKGDWNSWFNVET